MCNDNLNSIDSQALSTSGQSLNFTKELSHENVSNDETPVAAAIIPEATNDPIVINDLVLARESEKFTSFPFSFFLVASFLF
jgi:hypothetical protein